MACDKYIGNNMIMKTRYFFLVFTLLSAVAFSQDINRIKGIVKDLSSSEFLGRGYAHGGAEKASNYILDAFVESGLSRPDSGWIQSFNFDFNCIRKTRIEINDKNLIPGKDFIVRRGSPNGNSDYRLKEISSEHFLDTEKMKDFLNDTLNEVVAIIDFQDFVKNRKAYDTCVKMLFHSDIPGYVFLHEKELKDYMAFGIRQKQCFVVNIQKRAMPALPHSFHYMFDADFKEVEAKNVMAYLPGTGQSDSVIIICGHYDHLGTMGPDAFFPGADDNASSIATMIELADFLNKPENRPAKSVLFVAFSAEEVGLVGSNYFVNHLPIAKQNISFVLNIDMIGFGENGIYLWNGKNEPNLTQRILKINNDYQLFDSLYVKENTPNSDHYSFTKKEIPAVFLSTGIDASVYYHTIFDNYENVSFAKIEEVFKLIQLFIREESNKSL